MKNSDEKQGDKTMAKYKRILITGAAGRLGSQLRGGLAHLAHTIRLTDVNPIADLGPNEEFVQADLDDLDAVVAACEGCDAIVHFGARADEDKWQVILHSNIIGGYNVYEGARRGGAKRVVYASSVHAIGFHKIVDQIDAHAPHRPDSLYGVAKCFMEDLSRMYFDKFGLESVCCRIFSSFPEPADRRHLWSYLSFDDCVRMVEASLRAPVVEHTILFATSDNRETGFDNRLAGHIGFHPQDNTEPFRAAMEAATPEIDPKLPRFRFLGGYMTKLPHPDDAKA